MIIETVSMRIYESLFKKFRDVNITVGGISLTTDRSNEEVSGYIKETCPGEIFSILKDDNLTMNQVRCWNLWNKNGV